MTLPLETLPDWEERTRAEISRMLEIPGIKAAFNELVKAETGAPALVKPESESPKKITEASPMETNIDRFAQVLTDPPPAWFVEIYPGGEQKGFTRRLQHHSLIMLDRGTETLVVTFDNLSNVNDLSFGRVPWGYKFLKEQGHSHLGVMHGERTGIENQPD